MDVAASGDRRRHGARIDPPAALAPSARVPRLRCHCWHEYDEFDPTNDVAAEGGRAFGALGRQCDPRNGAGDH